MNDISVQERPITHQKIFDLEKVQLSMAQVEIPVTNRTGPGFLEQTIEIPAGTSLTGAIQKYRTINFVTKGSMHVLTASGMMEDIKAPWSEISPAGIKRVGIAYEDTIWTTVFITDETDPAKVRSEFTTNDQQEYLEFSAKQLEGK